MPFMSPGGNATAAIQAMLVQQQELERQRMLDAVKVQAEDRMGRQTDAQTTALEESTRASVEARATAAAKARAEMATAATNAAVGRQMPGAAIPASDIPLIPDAYKDVQTTLPARVGTVDTGPAPGVVEQSAQDAAANPTIQTPMPSTGHGVPGLLALPQTPTGVVNFRGTVEQQQLKSVLDDPAMPTEVKQLVRAGGKPTADMFQDKSKPIVRVDEDKTNPELWQGGKWVPLVGNAPENATVLQKSREPKGGSGQTPFFIIKDSAEGILAINGRDPTDVRRVGDLKPGATAEKEIRSAKGVVSLLNNIEDKFDPESIGPIIGRLKGLQQEYWGSDPDYARFQQNIKAVGNQIIQLRTGAQMSVQEATRILAEVASGTLPLETFKARLAELKTQYTDYLTERSKAAYGRTTKEDIDAMTGTNTGPAGAKPGGSTPPAPGASPLSADDLIKKYGRPGAKTP